MRIVTKAEKANEMDMAKEKYITPDMDVIEFEDEDIITTSGDIDEGEFPMG